jgi:hypothetical protein
MAKKSKRINFDNRILEIIARRAGYRCSFPGCSKTLVGPGTKYDESVAIGECAHIFSAVPTGPRTSGGLTDDELNRPENGIYLCRNHHRIVDIKSKDNKYTSDLLTRYKNRHEFLISAELGEYSYPLNWINSITVKKGTIFNNPIKINFGKVTLFSGANGTGKSTIVELLSSYFKQSIYSRWNKPNFEFITEIHLDNPVLSTFDAILRNNLLFYKISGIEQPFVPYDFFVLFLRETTKSYSDDLKNIGDCLGLDRQVVKTMLLTTGVKHGFKTKRIEIEEVRTNPYPVDILKVDIGSGRLHSFSSYSSTEQSSIILDITISFAKEISMFKSVLLLIDWSRIYSFDDANIRPYFDLLQSSNAHFQSILVSHKEWSDLDWSGWVIAKFKGSTPTTTIVQNEK